MIGKILQSKMETLLSSGGGTKVAEEERKGANISMALINETRLDMLGPQGQGPEGPIGLEDLELFQGYPTPLLHFATVCCVLFILLGIPGNLGTIVALYRCKKVRNATAVFIMNLSVSDLMFCCFNLPLAASTFYYRAWRHGSLLCQLFPLLRYGLLAVSLFTVLAITINRYVMIGHPTLYPKLYRKEYLGLMVACTWVSGFGALVATWSGVWGQFGLDPDIGSCSILPDQNGNSPKAFLFLVAFVIPCISIVVCYARIFYIVRKTALKSRSMPRCLTPSSKLSVEQSTTTTSKCKSSSCEDSAIGTSTTNASTDRSSSVYLDLRISPAHFEKEVQQNIYNTKNEPKYLIRTERVHFLEKKACPNKSFLHKRALSDSRLNIMEKRLILKPRKSIEINQKKYYISSNPTSPVLTSPAQEEPPKKHYLQPPIIIRSSDELSTRSCSPEEPSKPRKKKRMTSVFGRGSSSPRSPRKPGVPQPGKMTAKDKKLLKMILVIFLSFLVCYLPITISKTFRHVMEVPSLNIAGYILIYLTTCINPIIYVVMSSEYRQAYKNLLMCRAGDSSGQNRSNSQK